jgi:succinate-semialdehyde dehydrogenase/glutarate-semialdehyde dehydrogenase
MGNAGQSCNAGKRFIVERSIAFEFERAFAVEMQRYRMADPLDANSNLGPLSSIAARDTVHQQVRDSIANGARIVIGGEVPEQEGAWYPPTILSDVAPGQPAYDEEIFGPVAALIVVDSAEEAIAVANDSEFGLGAAVFTSELTKGENIARDELQAGTVFVNGNVRSDPRLPFGGIRNSGYGRECSAYGIREFVNVKTIRVRQKA